MDSNIVLTTAGSAIGAAFLIEHLKLVRWFPWLDPYSEGLNRLAGIAAAGAVSVGIHYEWDVERHGVFIYLPTMAQFAHIGWNWFVQWALQQYAYKTGVKSTSDD